MRWRVYVSLHTACRASGAAGRPARMLLVGVKQQTGPEAMGISVYRQDRRSSSSTGTTGLVRMDWCCRFLTFPPIQVQV